MNLRRWQIFSVRKRWLFPCWVAVAAFAMSCQRQNKPGPALQIVDESFRLRYGEPLPDSSSIFDGNTVHVVMSRGEVFGIQILSTTPQTTSVHLEAKAITVEPFEQTWVTAIVPSSDMYGDASRGAGKYADGLLATATPSNQLALFDISVPVSTPAQTVKGVIVVGSRHIPLTIEVVDVVLSIERPLRVWGYFDEREFEWSSSGSDSAKQASCIGMFRRHGVLASTTLQAAQWPAHESQFNGADYIPVKLSSTENPEQIAAIVADWSAIAKATGKNPFAIPIDEPRTDLQRADTKRIAALVRLARDRASGPNRSANFLFAVTAEPRAEFGDAIDLFFTPATKLGQSKSVGKPIFTYNGRPPGAGSMVVDTSALSVRTWGAIGFRYNINFWYIWDVLYWHDRHNRDRDPKGRVLIPTSDAMSFHNRDDVGNLDGVLAFPDASNGCLASLRLKQLRRGMYDRSLLEAANCNGVGDAVAARLVPVALGDASHNDQPSWPKDEQTWARARQELMTAAGECQRRAR
jgi:hypothetical protein